MTTTKFTEAQKLEALEILTDDGFFEVMTLEDFMTGCEPYQVARMVKRSNLNLDCKYIRVNGYYSDVQEADKMTDLIADDEVEEIMKELDEQSGETQAYLNH